MGENTAEEMVGEWGEAEFALRIVEQVMSPARSHNQTWARQPLPVKCMNRFGMKVARSPCWPASSLTMNLKNTCRSSVTSASSKA
jgi:hypothetical protein